MLEKIYDEIMQKNDIVRQSVIASPFIETKSIIVQSQYEWLNTILDIGETEAIVLAKQLSTILLIDERKGRSVAQNLNIDIMGFLGVLYLNYQNNFINIDNIIAYIEKAQKQEYRMSKKLIDSFTLKLRK